MQTPRNPSRGPQLAHGRDYPDVPPWRGVYKGTADETRSRSPSRFREPQNQPRKWSRAPILLGRARRAPHRANGP